MNELSLFTGAGGGLLGTTLLGWMHIGYVENNKYCQRIIRQRIIDGILDEAPIFGDIRVFIGEGFAASYTGMVDVITAGFPCQPFSVAGKRYGENDERNMWPQTIECVRIIRPQFALLENVPGLLAHQYTQRIFGDLAESGYDARWCVLGADDVGAPHRRKRLWIVAESDAVGRGWRENDEGKAETERDRNTGAVIEDAGRNRYAADPEIVRRREGNEDDGRTSKGAGTQEKRCGSAHSGGFSPNTGGKRLPWSKRPGSHDKGQAAYESITKRNNTWSEPWPEVATRLCGVDDGVAHRVDRLKAIGNGQVPAVVARAWQSLTYKS